MYFILSLTSLWTQLAPLTSCLAEQIGSCLEFQQDAFFSGVIRVNTLIKNIRAITGLPVCSGFGIKTPSDAKDIAKTGCDAVVVGSTFVKYIQDNIDDKKLPQRV